MNKISELKSILGQTFHWHKSRLDCFSQMLVALFAVRTVNLKEIALAMLSRATTDSRYRRLQRFFAFFDIDYDTLAIWIFRLFFQDEEKVYISIDRTNWYWGKAPINVFVLSVIYEGIAIPLLWQTLPKDGTSNTNERILLVGRFIKLFGKTPIEGLLGDREFVGKEWFQWLDQNKIPFFIRVKENFNIKVFCGKGGPAKYYFKGLPVKHQKVYENRIKLFGIPMWLAAGRSEKGELLIVVTNQRVKNPVSVYLRRWEIETLFLALKSNGFRFESTHMTSPERIDKLMALLAVGFSWAHKVGEWRATVKQIVMKRHPDNTIRPQTTYFRYGLDLIREIIFHINIKGKEFVHCLGFLMPTSGILP